jgi:hypothetical protein
MSPLFPYKRCQDETDSPSFYRFCSLLEHPQDSEALNWTTGGTSFKVTSNETKALAALAPNCGFRSFSSFIRQLSYYDFK